MNNIYKKKSLERLATAKWQIETKNTSTLGSILYFALFNFMQSVLGKPPENKSNEEIKELKIIFEFLNEVIRKWQS